VATRARDTADVVEDVNVALGSKADYPSGGSDGNVLTKSGTSATWTDSRTVGGLVHINTTTVSGAVSHSFGSDADPIFTSNFTNYRIVIDALIISTDTDLRFRLRANTTDLSSGAYSIQQFTSSSTTNSSVRSNDQTSALFGKGSSSSSMIIELQNPQTTKTKTFLVQNHFFDGALGSLLILTSGYVFNSSSYNGFTIFSTGNVGAIVNVFGYQK